MKSYSFNKRSKGFGLLEVILVFAIVIGAAAVVFTVFQSAKPSADASNEGSNVSTIATNLKSTYGISNSYAGMTKANAISAKAIPSSMTDGTLITSSWGDVDVKAAGAAAGVCATAGRCFDITYNAVPTDTCAKLVQGVAGFFDDIQVGGASVLDSTTGKPSSTNIVSKCAGTSGASTVDVDFFGH